MPYHEEDFGYNFTVFMTEKRGGFNKPCQLSTQLAEFLSCDVLPRTEVAKRMWVYIRANDLQNPKDRREILCDEKLENVLKRKRLTMFQLNKVLAPVSNYASLACLAPPQLALIIRPTWSLSMVQMMKTIADLQEGPKRKKRETSAGTSSSAKPKKVNSTSKKQAHVSAKKKKGKSCIILSE